MRAENSPRSKATKFTAVFVAAAMTFLGVVYAPETIANTTISQLGLDIDGEAAFDLSGDSVSLSADGSRVAIGAPFNDGDAGHVRIFDLIGGTWTQVGADIDGEAADDASGRSVSLSADGSRVAIGAPGNDGAARAVNLAGHVRIYDWIMTVRGMEWTQVGADIDGEAADDQSGFSVSLSADGRRVAIGARFNDGAAGAAGFAGHVRIFDLIGGTWTPVGGDIDGEAFGDRIGWSVSLSADGSRVAIGAPENNGNAGGAVDAGQVRIYDLIGGTWTPVRVAIFGEAAFDLSGLSVSLSADGSRVAIGAPGNDGAAGPGSFAGHTRIFSLLPAPAPAPAPYQGPIFYLASPSTAFAGEQITVTGIRLNSISSVQIDGVEAAIVSVEDTRLIFTLPNGLEVGTKSIVFIGSYGKLTFFANLEYKAALPPAVLQPKKVNAGSFKGHVAVYAKGHKGQILSWKIAGKWFKKEITSNYQVFKRKTAAVGKEVKVDLFIDGKSQLSKRVRTR